ncbi:hypothetical protein GXW71_10240 [Roseomonas hellenica]|uniref:Uncharacterized protein n=1 Tax=Plastoroseomonas hellenica TaxID=2687306 RepID=A0ABS5EWR1_9PROT|nr:hypothetical protein [Plastoroseomonas hellenica]MBR0664729.1 hypothetical protein [Plastoroseomonas hellenica]
MLAASAPTTHVSFSCAVEVVGRGTQDPIDTRAQSATSGGKVGFHPVGPGRRGGLAAGAFFGWVFHERYWLWRRCFNELGRCWDEVGEQVYVEQAGVIWGTVALLPLIAGLPLLVWAHRHRS